MNRSHLLVTWVSFVVCGFLSGCAGGSTTLSNVVEAIEGIKGSSSPIVDAYIQFPAPEAKWAGPALWTVHVSAHDSQKPVFEVNPTLPKLKESGVPELVGRVPASSLGLTQGKTSASPAAAIASLSQQQVRERLQHLAETLSSADDESSACVSSIKVRLTRADGTILEKQACRGSQIWTQVASELAAEFMTMSRVSQSTTSGT